MSSEQPTIAGDIHEMLDKLHIQPKLTMEKDAAAPLTDSIPEDQPVIKTYVDIVSEMSKETKLGKVTDVFAMIKFGWPDAPDAEDVQAAEDENEPEWYQ